MEGYAAMGALATDKGLRTLDGLGADAVPNWSRACRPFGDNCGFTMAESAQVVILFDDALAIEMGAPLLAAVPEVSVSADGAKKSISGPGAGNYITVARAATAAASVLGQQRFQRGGMVQAHGTGTPQNRVTESTILSRVAAALGVEEWRVGAIKSFIGHSLGAAAGDQLSAMLGVWETGLLPGITTISALADDVVSEKLSFPLATETCEKPEYALINSKGFGGNNATAAILGPAVTHELLLSHHGRSGMKQWADQHEGVQQLRRALEESRLAGSWSPTYRFDDGVVGDEDIQIERDRITVSGRVVELDADLPSNWRL
jgi:acetoacetyl-[acyl-carrier protein] synthase